jgi:hypothetical protein
MTKKVTPTELGRVINSIEFRQHGLNIVKLPKTPEEGRVYLALRLIAESYVTTVKSLFEDQDDEEISAVVGECMMNPESSVLGYVKTRLDHQQLENGFMRGYQ